MNEINSNFISVEHDFMDKDGKYYPGFIGIFQKVGQTNPTIFQQQILDHAYTTGKMVFFGSVDEVVRVLNESRKESNSIFTKE